MAVSQTKLMSILQQRFPNAKIKIHDLTGNEDNYSIYITCSIFEGLTLIKQHRLVKNALSNFLKEKKLHAITVKTLDQ